MKRIIVSTLLLLILASCGDDENPTTPTEKNEPLLKGNIKGYIIDAATDLPVSGAIISTFPITSTTRSDENGKFELPEISPDIYDLNIKHKNYLAYTSKIKVSDRITNDIELFITSIESANNRPNKPTLTYPLNGANIGVKEIKFTWECKDIDNDSLKYDVFFRIVGSDFQIIGNNLITKTLDYEYSLNGIDKFEWYVIAKDNYAFSISDTFSFNFKETVITDIPNMIGNWKFDGNATDYGPNSYASSIQNVFFVNDRKNNFEYAASFQGNSGSNSKVILPTSIQLSNQFTIALWIKALPTLGENGSVGNYDCISKWGSTGAGKTSWTFGINKSRNLFLGTYGNSTTLKATDNIEIDTEVWIHIAVTFKAGTATFYIDGENVYTAGGMQNPQFSNFNASIGGRQDQLSSFHGAIDDVYIFDRELSDQEIQSLSQE